MTVMRTTTRSAKRMTNPVAWFVKTARHVSSGFDRISLDTSPRLRQARQDLSYRDPVLEAWIETAKALTEATTTVRKSCRLG